MEGVGLVHWLAAWARVAPALALLPGLALSGLAPSARVAVGLALALPTVPAPPLLGAEASLPLVLGAEVLRGLAPAVGAAAALHALGLAGALTDTIRASRERLAVLGPEPEGPVESLLGLLAAVFFFSEGGPARLARALGASRPAVPVDALVAPWLGALELAVTLATPLLLAALLVDVATALVARATHPAALAAALHPLRGTVVLLSAGWLVLAIADGWRSP